MSTSWTEDTKMYPKNSQSQIAEHSRFCRVL